MNLKIKEKNKEYRKQYFQHNKKILTNLEKFILTTEEKQILIFV